MLQCGANDPFRPATLLGPGPAALLLGPLPRPLTALLLPSAAPPRVLPLPGRRGAPAAAPCAAAGRAQPSLEPHAWLNTRFLGANRPPWAAQRRAGGALSSRPSPPAQPLPRPHLLASAPARAPFVSSPLCRFQARCQRHAAPQKRTGTSHDDTPAAHADMRKRGALAGTVHGGRSTRRCHRPLPTLLHAQHCTRLAGHPFPCLGWPWHAAAHTRPPPEQNYPQRGGGAQCAARPRAGGLTAHPRTCASCNLFE
ncbi:MAG: hypothetical protein J3K34DRAFT_429798 [Monoraphidium minutum]|nr:MAG: hypothetical protein J3K34DRAFT_429798 [Monoraphidium minutum]